MHISSRAQREAAKEADRTSGILWEGENMTTVYLSFLQLTSNVFNRANRAKYDAWKRMGELPREKAMEGYVEELRKIVETMSYSENVADFYGSIQELDNVNLSDLQLIAPAAIQKEISNPDSPLHSRETSPQRPITNGYGNGYQNGYSHSATDTSDDDEYIDTVEVIEICLAENYHDCEYFTGRVTHPCRSHFATAW